jgi:hypothetical protein
MMSVTQRTIASRMAWSRAWRAERGHCHAKGVPFKDAAVYDVSLIVIWTVLRNFTGTPFCVAGR